MKRSLLSLKNGKLKYLSLVLLTNIFLINSFFVVSVESASNDTDSDGLIDAYENFLGSNYNDSSDVISILISDLYYYLVDTDQDNVSDVFFDASLYRYNDITITEGILYIDYNFDGEFDYTYDSDLTHIEEQSFDIPWLYVILGIIIIVVILIIITLFKKGILYFYEEEYVVEE
jgi:hypothetical protein